MKNILIKIILKTRITLKNEVLFTYFKKATETAPE